MLNLWVHDILWCAQHGHPFLMLRLDGTDRYFAVSMAPDDAASLALQPFNNGGPSRTRLMSLLESTIAGLGAELTEVQLRVGDDAVLHAVVRIMGPEGEMTLPTYFADGIALAHRRRLPLRMAEDDVARVPLSPDSLPRLDAIDPGHVQLAPYREVIESLDLDDFGSPG